MDPKRVMVIGGGVAGICAALDLAELNFGVDLIEKSRVLGGHAARLSCKATDSCVQCGACLVHHRLALARTHPRIGIHTASELVRLEKKDGFAATLNRQDPSDPSAGPCREMALRADAIVVATGFALFDPAAKPYGHGLLPDVVTNFELEQILRAQHRLLRPSDGKVPMRIAFVQCVGSRDTVVGHPWCSRFCCASALRSAAWIKANHPDTEITMFYIDIQNTGQGPFPSDKPYMDKIQMVRSIPGDICPSKEGRLRITYWDPEKRAGSEVDVDMAVLSAGMRPSDGTAAMARLLGIDPVPWESGDCRFVPELPPGVFWAGAAAGPRTIAETVASAGAAAWQAACYLGLGH